MRRYFISGGSSGVPKDVSHDFLEWQYIILDTASVLRAFGVKKGSVVLIAQPSFPWSIGDVFAEAAVMCGADIICYGLEAGEEAFVPRWLDKNISHIIASPSLLLRWVSKNVKPAKNSILIVAGEVFDKAKEERIQELWEPADIRRIYGMSELGTLGYQFMSKAPLLCMNPRFSYWLEGNENPKPEDIGKLIITPKYGGEAIVTKDIVRVCSNHQGCEIWDKTFIIEFVNRSNNVLTLSDGTAIEESVITSLVSKFGLNAVQCIYRIERDKETLIFNYVCPNSSVHWQDLRREILILVPELCDEFAKRNYHIELNQIDYSELETTDRGKLPLFLVKNDEGGKDNVLQEKIINHPWFNKRVAEYYRWYPKSLSVIDSAKFELTNSSVEGLYIHIPYCDKICSFCPYNKKKSSPSDYDYYINNLIKELQLYQDRVNMSELKYIYFGGGTPSVLSIDQISLLLEQINTQSGINKNTEISFEAHPTHLNKDYINSLKGTGVNRISTGVQSFDGNRLKIIGATHSAEDSISACQVLEDNIDNYGIDLLYRCQGQSLNDWELELEKCLSFSNIKHISCYSLFLPNNDLQPTPEDEAAMAVLAYEYFRFKGFNHYASCATGGFDFAKNGYEGKYEKRHWEAPQGEYLGIGAGAFGYVNNTLTVNYHSLEYYGALINKRIKPISQIGNTLQREEKHRYFVLGVKTMEVDLNKYSELFLSDPMIDFNSEFIFLQENGLIEICDKKLKISEVGRFYVDQISEVFWSSSQKDVEHPETSELRKIENNNLRNNYNPL